MPAVFRTMRSDGGRPLVGSTGRSLGVRPIKDIPVDGKGNVRPDTGGMSVASSWRDLSPWRIPERLVAIAPNACGSNLDSCWRLGTGAFVAAELPPHHLYFRPDTLTHGTVEPALRMSLEEYQRNLAATRDEWEIDES